MTNKEKELARFDRVAKPITAAIIGLTVVWWAVTTIVIFC